MEESIREHALAVQRMQDYIENHINDTITLADLARVSLFSPWYSYRLFKEQTNYTPSDYIRRLKLSKSALRLKNGNCRITDVAFDFGFHSVDGYQRAFHKEFGCNPSAYAKNPIPIYLFTPYRIIYQDMRKEYKAMKDVKNVYIQRITKPKRKVLIKRGIAATDYFAYCEEVGCEIWGLLTSIQGISGEPVCLWLPSKYRKPNTSEYVQGVEVSIDYDGQIPEGFDIIELPEAEYMAFQGEPFLEEDYCQAIDEVQESITRYDPTIWGYEWDLSQPQIQLEPVGTRGYIELKAIKKK